MVSSSVPISKFFLIIEQAKKEKKKLMTSCKMTSSPDLIMNFSLELGENGSCVSHLLEVWASKHPLKTKRGLFLVSWLWNWTLALFMLQPRMKMALTEGRKFSVRGRAGRSKPNESWWLQGFDLFLFTLRVALLVQCGKMSESASLASSLFFVYVFGASWLLHLFWNAYSHLCI